MAEVAKGIIDIEINTGSAASELRALQTQINAFNLALNKSNKAQGAFAAEYSKELQGAINKTGLFTAETVRLSTAAATLDKTLSKGKTSLGQFFSAKFNKDSAIAAETMALAAERAKRLQTQFIATSGAANGFQEAIAVRPLAAFSSEAAIAAQRTQLLSNMFKQGTTQLINFGKNVQWAGRQLMVGFTVPLTIFGSVAGKTFMDLEKQAVAFKKVYGDIFTTPAELDKNLEAVKGLASEYTKYGIAVKDTIGLAAQAAAAGRQNADLTDAVSQATRLATLGQMDQNAALETTISLQSAFRLSGKDLADTINFLNMVENQTVVSLQDIAAAIPRVAPVIQGLGGDVKDLTVFLAAMQEGGVDAAEGANALKSGLASLINPTKQATEMLNGMGINLETIIQANRGDLMGTVMAFSQALSSLDQFSRQQALEQVFGKFQYAKLGALFDNISRKGSQAQQVIATMGYSTEQLGATADKELKTIEESFGVQLIGAVERFKLAIAPIGQLFVQLAIPVVNFITKIVDGFNSLSEGQRKFIAIATVIVGVVVPAVTMLAGLFLNLIGTLAKMTQGFALFAKGFITGGPVGAFRALSQSSKYLSLAEIDAAMAAQQLSDANGILNKTLVDQAIQGNAAAAAINNLTRAYGAMVATQRGAGSFPGFGVAAAAGSAAKEGKTSALTVRGLRRNSGGGVPGVGNTDTVPAMLTPGEFVINKEATSQNLGLLKAINDGNIVGYNKGGKVPGVQYFGTNEEQRIVQSIKELNNISGGFRELNSQIGNSIPLRTAPLMTSAQFSSVILNSPSLDDMITRLGLSIFGIPDTMNRAMAASGGGIKVLELLEFLNDGGPDVFETLNDALEQTGSDKRIDTKKMHQQIIQKLEEVQLRNPGALIKDSPSLKNGISYLGLNELVDEIIDPSDKKTLESLRQNNQSSGRLNAKRGAKKLESDARIASVVREYLSANGLIDDETEIKTRRIPGKGAKSKPTVEIYDDKGNVYHRFQYGATMSNAEKGVPYTGLRLSQTFERITKSLKIKGSKFSGATLSRAHFASGGTVPGFGSSDTVPAMLTPGEFVVNKKAASQNQGILEMMNGGNVKGYALGGIVTGAGTAAQMGGLATGNMPVMIAGTVLQMLGPAIGRLQGSLKEGAKLGPSLKNMIPTVSRFAFGMTSMAGGLALAGFAIYKLNKQINNAEKSGAEFTNAMYGSSKTIEGIAQQFGTQTNAQAARIAAVERIGGQQIGEEAQAQSAQFVQSEAGKQMLKDVGTVKAGGGDAVEALRNQLSAAIISGAIGTEEARAIAVEVGTALGDQSIAVGVSGELTKLMGPDGGDLLKNLSSITAEISPKIDATKLASDATSAYEKMNVGARFVQAFQGGESEFIKNYKLNEISAANSAAFAKEAQARELLNLAYQEGTITLKEYQKQSSAITQSSEANQNLAATALGFQDRSAMITAAQGTVVTAGRGGGAVIRTDQQKQAQASLGAEKKELEDFLLTIPGQTEDTVAKISESIGKLGQGAFGDILSGRLNLADVNILVKLKDGGLNEKEIEGVNDKLQALKIIPDIDTLINVKTTSQEQITDIYDSLVKFQEMPDKELNIYAKDNFTSVIQQAGVTYDQFAALPDLEKRLVLAKMDVVVKVRADFETEQGILDSHSRNAFAEEVGGLMQSITSSFAAASGAGAGSGSGAGSGGSGGKDAKKELEDLLKMLMERFRLQEMLIDKEAEGFNNRVKQLNREIELEERQVSLRQKSLEQLSKKEEEVNKAYDARVKVLDKVSESNSRASEQQRSATSLASALASGDVAAAANIANEMQQQSAQYQIEDTRATLEEQRQKDLESLTVSINGQLMTRKGIEFEIETIQDRIYNRGQEIKDLQDSLLVLEEKKLDIAKEREKVETRMYLLEQQSAIQKLSGKKLTKEQKAELAEYKASYNQVVDMYNAANPGSKIEKKNYGGMIAKMAFGGIAYKGSNEPAPALRMNYGSTVPGIGMTDKVPALLTPGEFVVRKSVAEQYGGFLNQLNGQVFPGLGQGMSSPEYSIPESSVTNIPVNNTNVVSTSAPMYNSTYNVNVNVSGTNASPDDIANVVMAKLSNQNRGNLRSSRY